MFFDTDEINATQIEVFRLERAPYRRAAGVRPFHAISFRLSGEAKYETEGKILTAGAGDILFVPAFSPYIKDTSAEQFYVVHFYAELPIDHSLKALTPTEPEKYRQLFEQMLTVQTQKEAGYTHRVRQLFYGLLGNMEEEYAGQIGTPMESAMHKALRIIHENYMDPEFSVGSLPGMLNMSETYFRRQFRRIHKTSPKQYVTALKVETAKELLRSGYYTVGQVATQCGFGSCYYFSAFMKQATGRAPKEWMEELTEK